MRGEVQKKDVLGVILVHPSFIPEVSLTGRASVMLQVAFSPDKYFQFTLNFLTTGFVFLSFLHSYNE